MTRRTTQILGGLVLVAAAACARPGPRPGSAPESTGAITSVSAGQATGGPLTVDELLRGKAAGLQIIPRPEGGVSFRIRGSASVHEPLVLVDGVEIQPGNIHNALAGLTREDIKRVDVLKDVASTSVYGMRGVGGVIVITTTRR